MVDMPVVVMSRREDGSGIEQGVGEEAVKLGKHPGSQSDWNNS
jgi:hypothetical protein